jgi:hypothetical protein
MARTYLNCPFDEKDQAKALGARWDATKKRWYVDIADLSPFSRWLPESGGAAAPAPSRPARTGPAQPPAHCGCDVLPWEPCVHTPRAAS